MPGRDRFEIDAAKALANKRSQGQERGIYKLPEGYIAGLKVSVNGNGQVIVKKGIANIRGKRVENKTDWILNWENCKLSKKLTNTRYYIYLSDQGKFWIDVLPSVYSNDYYGYYHAYYHNWRYIGLFDYLSDGTYTNIVSQDPLEAKEVETLLLRATQNVIIGYSGTGTSSFPDEGDRMCYIDNDEVLLAEYTGGEWSTVNGIKIGGAIAGLFLSMIGCGGCYHPNNPPTATEYLAHKDIIVYNFEGNYENHLGVDDWDVKTNVATSSAQAKFGSSSFTGTLGNFGGLSRASYYTIGSDLVVACWIYVDTFDYGSLGSICAVSGTTDFFAIHFNGTSVRFGVRKDGAGAWSYYTINEDMMNKWSYVGFSYDSTNDTLYYFVNTTKRSQVLGNSWGSGTASLQLIGYNWGPSIISYLDEAFYLINDYVDVDVLIQHYTHGVAWDTNYTAKDIFFQADTAGKIQLLSETVLHNYSFQPPTAKTTDYTVTAEDTGKYFTTTGASAAVTFTLPALKAGLTYTFHNTVDYDMTITDGGNDTLVVLNDAAADSIAFDQASNKIGAGAVVICDGSKWLVRPFGTSSYTIST